MVESLHINKVQVKEKLIVDSLAKMENTEDFDFSPRPIFISSKLGVTLLFFWKLIINFNKFSC